MERELIPKMNSNPFKINNDYLADLETQQQFLTPQNSNFSE